MLHQSIMFGNGKGGVGKTSMCANLAGLAAKSGWRTLAVDLDPQGNLGSDLGYKQQGLSDEGEGMFNAVVAGARLRPLRRVRPNLDVVPAGAATKDLLAVLTNRRTIDPRAICDVARVLAPLEDSYDLILIDSPPAGGVAVDAALAATHWLVIPVKFDEGSIDGLELMARQFGSIRTSVNPDLVLLGVALFDFSTRGTVIRSEVREQLNAELQGTAPVFKSIVRRAERAAYDMRREGILAHEYSNKGKRLKHAGGFSGRRTQRSSGDRQSTAAGGLAEDYKKLATEILLSLGEVAHLVKS